MKITTSKRHDRGILLIAYLLGLVVGTFVIIAGIRYYVNADGTVTPAPINASNYMTNLPSYNPTNSVQ